MILDVEQSKLQIWLYSVGIFCNLSYRILKEQSDVNKYVIPPLHN